jgi:membrane protease YdiL (CAAX protease family)
LVRNRFVTIVVAVIGAAVVAALFLFNQRATYYNQYIVGNLIGLFWVPMLSILFIIREDPERFGWTLGSSKKVWIVTAVVFVGLAILMIPASKLRVFQDYYPLFRRYPEFSGSVFGQYPRVSPWDAAPLAMAYAEASYGMYLFCWEFFFRGYLLLGLSRSIGWAAVLVQAAAFGLLHYGKPGIEVIASFGAGVILGIIALNAKSFVPCFVLHWAAALSFDFLVIATRPQPGAAN